MNQKLRSSQQTQSITTAMVPVTSSFWNENIVHALKPQGVDRTLESPQQAHSKKMENTVGKIYSCMLTCMLSDTDILKQFSPAPHNYPCT